jgi:hypothetical protein
MEQEWQARAVATGVTLSRDSQLETLNKHVHGVVTHEADTGRLTVVWRIKATEMKAASEAASEEATHALYCAFGGEPELRELHVVHADDVEVDGKAILAALGVAED